MFQCEATPLAPTVDQISTWMILPYTRRSLGVATFLFDHNDDQFTNLLDDGKKQPLAVKGDILGADANDPVFNQDSIRFSGGRRLKIDNSGIGEPETERLRVHTHLMQMRIRQLPDKTSKKKIFMTLINDKKMEIYLTFDQRFIFKTGSQTKITKPFNFINFKWYKTKIVYTRLVYAHDFFDCSVEIDIFGVGRDGQELNCKL